MGKLVRSISEDGCVIASAIDSSDIVEKIEEIHKTSAVCTAALGRLVTVCGMLGYELKNSDDAITIIIDGGGPAGRLTAISDAKGHLKCDIQNNIVEIPLNSKGKLDVGGAVGSNGSITVIKDIGLKQPYIGVCELATGEIGEDIVKYMAESEQTPTACSVGVLVNPDLSVKRAGGFLIQLLPGTPEEDISQIENNISKMPHITSMLENGMDSEAVALSALEGLNPNVLDSGELEYSCDCSRERTIRILKSIGKTELLNLANEQETAEVQCHFCGKKYTFTSDELKHFAEEI